MPFTSCRNVITHWFVHTGNVVIEGGGTIDGDGDHWYTDKTTNNNERPMMLDLLWIDGLTVRDMKIRRPGYWTIHPCFSNNVRVTGNDILTTGTCSQLAVLLFFLSRHSDARKLTHSVTHSMTLYTGVRFTL